MLATLLQWADSAYPTGGFAYSSGLEAMARWPAFATLDHLRDYLDVVVEQAFAADMPFLMALHRAAKQGDLAYFIHLAWEWDAFLHQPTLRRASLAQGEAWLRLYRDAMAYEDKGDVNLAGASSPAMAFMHGKENADWPTHFLSALAQTSAAAGLQAESLRDLYLHLIVRDQVAAAVRLGLLGANLAQALQTRVTQKASSDWQTRPIAAPEDAVRCAPVLELVQALHPHLYVRLFQN